uniref:Uncharacterized protein n=1 Tax=Anguilla anguilla TaxID=7936 RepID=A0A0E9PT74_ANGAN
MIKQLLSCGYSHVCLLRCKMSACSTVCHPSGLCNCDILESSLQELSAIKLKCHL